jgi:hypothetical protein
LASRAPAPRWPIFGPGRLAGGLVPESGRGLGTPLSEAYTQKMVRVFDMPGGLSAARAPMIGRSLKTKQPLDRHERPGAVVIFGTICT